MIDCLIENSSGRCLCIAEKAFLNDEGSSVNGGDGMYRRSKRGEGNGMNGTDRGRDKE